MSEKLLIISLIIVTSFSCTRSNFATRSETTSTTTEVHPVPLIDNTQHEIEVKKPKKTTLSEIEYQDLSNKRELSDISNFTENEKKYVSTSTSFDPFKNDNPLVIDLDQLERSFTYPCKGDRISNYGMRSGRFHSGVDLKVEHGENVYSALPGVVRFSRSYGAYGNVIVVRHTVGIETVYSHNSKNLVKVGDIVKEGDVIALGGKSGNATTTHIHFEVRAKGKTIDPNLFLNTSEKSLQSGKLYLTYRNNQVTATSNKQTKEVSKKVEKTDNNKKERQKQQGVLNSKTHTIKKGDSLYAIAKRYGTTVDKICKDNNIKKTSKIYPGQKLKIK